MKWFQGGQQPDFISYSEIVISPNQWKNLNKYFINRGRGVTVLWNYLKNSSIFKGWYLKMYECCNVSGVKDATNQRKNSHLGAYPCPRRLCYITQRQLLGLVQTVMNSCTENITQISLGLCLKLLDSRLLTPVHGNTLETENYARNTSTPSHPLHPNFLDTTRDTRARQWSTIGNLHWTEACIT